MSKYNFHRLAAICLPRHRHAQNRAVSSGTTFRTTIRNCAHPLKSSCSNLIRESHKLPSTALDVLFRTERCWAPANSPQCAPGHHRGFGRSPGMSAPPPIAAEIPAVRRMLKRAQQTTFCTAEKQRTFPPSPTHYPMALRRREPAPSTTSNGDMRISYDEQNTPHHSKPLDLRELETKRYRARPARPPTMRLWQAAQ